mgnify:CR=1 FL=1
MRRVCGRQGCYFDIFLILNIIISSSSIVVMDSRGIGGKSRACGISLASLGPLVESVCVELEMVVVPFIYD